MLVTDIDVIFNTYSFDWVTLCHVITTIYLYFLLFIGMARTYTPKLGDRFLQRHKDALSQRLSQNISGWRAGLDVNHLYNDVGNAAGNLAPTYVMYKAEGM